MKYYVDKKIKIILLIIFINLITYSLAFSCRYTVRDIGFTDLGSTPYHLYFYVDNNTPEEIVSAFQRITYAALLDANVETETINIDRQTQHPAMDYFRSYKVESLPAVILSASDGTTLQLPFSCTGENYKESIWQLIETVVSSPLRKKLIDAVAKTYGAVLLIEGEDKEQNKLAQKALTKAIEDISHVLDIMPKPIKEPPQLIELTQDMLSKEKILLWSVDANRYETNEPQVVILYGKGRRIGPVLKGKEITKKNIFSLLALIGADCECGLDRSWMLGKMVPLRWDRKVQTALIRSLGFDVESPMVKSEMSQILSMTPALQGQNKKSSSPLPVYSEGIIKFDTVFSVPSVPSNQFRETTSSDLSAKGNSVFQMGLFWGSGFILIVFLIAGYIFVRAKRREN